MIHDKISKIIERTFSKEKLIKDLFSHLRWASTENYVKEINENVYEIEMVNALDTEQSISILISKKKEISISYLKYNKSFSDNVMPFFVCGLSIKELVVSIDKEPITCYFELYYNEFEEIYDAEFYFEPY